jgi:predicted phosphodiesterase
LVHHHFFQNAASGRKNKLFSAVENWTMAVEDRQRLFSLFKKNNVQAVLHGHVHTSVVYRKDHIYFSNAGGSLENKNGHGLKLNLLIIADDYTQITVQRIDPRTSNKIYHPAVPVSA